MKHESLEDIYLQMSTDELIMLITAYRHDKDNMLVSGDDIGADKAHPAFVSILRLYKL